MLRTSLILLLCAVLCCSIRIGHKLEMMTGAWGSVAVDSADQEIDRFIRNEFPELRSAKLVAVSQQVVAGMNYRYTYELGENTYTVTVWDQSWLNHRQVTAVSKVETKARSDGQKVRVTTTTRIQTRPFSEIVKETMQ